MLKSIKWKIFFGFLVLAFMLAVSGGITIYEFIRLNRTVNSLLEQNYNTIKASIDMLESLELEASGILLILSGDKELGNERLRQGDSAFQIAYNKALLHGNMPRNKALIDDIRIKHEEYKSNLSVTGLDKISNMRVSWYLNNLYPEFKNLKSSINALMIYNQDIIYSESNICGTKHKRRLCPELLRS